MHINKKASLAETYVFMDIKVSNSPNLLLGHARTDRAAAQHVRSSSQHLLKRIIANQPREESLSRFGHFDLAARFAYAFDLNTLLCLDARFDARFSSVLPVCFLERLSCRYE